MRAVLLAAVLLAASVPAGQAAIGLVTEKGVRTPIAEGEARGLLTSDSTRIDGLVTPADVAAGRLRIVAHDDPAEALRTLGQRIERNDRWRLHTLNEAGVAQRTGR